MRAGKYTLQELFVNRYIDRLVIPEIQRDYVWKPEQVLGLLNSIWDSYCKYTEASIPEMKSVDDKFIPDLLVDDFRRFYQKRNYSANVGFIYAYSDAQYEGRYFLIDGQQRITTLYLLTLLLAANYGRAEDFRKNFCSQTDPKLDYRVRDIPASFLKHLVTFVLDNPDADMKDQAWYLGSFEADATVASMVANMSCIKNWEASKNDLTKFYDYLCDFTELWYFDTNISSQGENLYIYLNARGEQVQANENLKADMLSRLNNDEEKNHWGRVWEEWQDFFWKMRFSGKAANSNADEGFNEFLSCITGLVHFLDIGANDKQYKSHGNDLIKPSVSMQLQELSITLIADYVNALKYISDNRSLLDDTYEYSGWLELFWSDFWVILNNEENAWVIDYSNDLHSKERNRMVFVWGILHWVSKACHTKDVVTIFRGIRQFYLRYKNNNRAVVGENGIVASIDNLFDKGFISIRPDTEEYIKERWFADKTDESERKKFESIIWEIEDHPYNLDGSDVGMTNISHLVDFSANPSFEALSRIKSAFYECFPGNDLKANSDFPLIQSVLLNYGDFFRRVSPWYYSNFIFTEWKRNIRPLVGGKRNAEFRLFLDELINSGLSVVDFLESKRNCEPSKAISNIREQLLWYNFHLKEKMWAKGGHIALYNDYEGDFFDAEFFGSPAFYNTNGGFRSPKNVNKLSRLI